MRAVNLLPPDPPQRKSFEGRGLIVVSTVLAGAIVVGALGGMYVSARNAVADRQSKLASVQAQIAATPRPPRQSAANQALASTKMTRIQALNTALAGRVAWDRVLRKMTLVLPSDVWLTDLSAGAPSTTATSTPTPSSGSSSCGSTGVCLTGNTYSQESVARALSRLSAVPELSNVQLLSSDEQDVGGQKTYVFKVKADLGVGGAS